VRRCFIGVMSTTCILNMQWYVGSPQQSDATPRYQRCLPLFCLRVVCHPKSHRLPPMLHHVFATFHRRAARDSIDGERGGYAEDEGDGRGQGRHRHREVRRVGRKRMWGLGRGGRFCSLIYVFTAYDKKSYVHKQDGSLCLLVPLVSGPIQHRPNRRSGR
jgi:hypothetical protein